MIGSFVASGERFLGGEWVLLLPLEVRERYVCEAGGEMTCAVGRLSSTAEIPRPLRFDDVETGLETGFLVDLICFCRGMSRSESESESSIFSADLTLTESFFLGTDVFVEAEAVVAAGFSTAFAAGFVVAAFAVVAFFFVIIPPPTFLTGFTISSSAGRFAGTLGLLGLIAGESICRGVFARGRSRSSLASLLDLFFGICVTTFSSKGGNLARISFCFFSTISFSLVV